MQRVLHYSFTLLINSFALYLNEQMKFRFEATARILDTSAIL